MFMGILSLVCLMVCGIAVSYLILKIKRMEVRDGGQYG